MTKEEFLRKIATGEDVIMTEVKIASPILSGSARIMDISGRIHRKRALHILNKSKTNLQDSWGEVFGDWWRKQLASRQKKEFIVTVKGLNDDREKQQKPTVFSQRGNSNNRLTPHKWR